MLNESIAKFQSFKIKHQNKGNQMSEKAQREVLFTNLIELARKEYCGENISGDDIERALTGGASGKPRDYEQIMKLARFLNQVFLFALSETRTLKENTNNYMRWPRQKLLLSLERSILEYERSM